MPGILLSNWRLGTGGLEAGGWGLGWRLETGDWRLETRARPESPEVLAVDHEARRLNRIDSVARSFAAGTSVGNKVRFTICNGYPASVTVGS